MVTVGLGWEQARNRLGMAWKWGGKRNCGIGMGTRLGMRLGMETARLGWEQGQEGLGMAPFFGNGALFWEQWRF